MPAWIRNNLVLVAGIVLPVLLVAAFLVLQSVPGVAPPPPEHDFVVAAYYHSAGTPQDHEFKFEVRDGRLHGIVVPADGSGRRDPMRVNLFRYVARENRIREIDWNPPGGLAALETPLEFEVGGLAGVALDPASQSPDGYRLEWSGYRSHGLLGELFGFGRRPSQWVLKKGDQQFELPPFEPLQYYGHNQLVFLGWVGRAAVEP